jgi:DNA polymerase-1
VVGKRIIFYDSENFGVNYRYTMPPEDYFRLFQWAEGRDGEVHTTTDRQEALEIIRSADLLIAWNQLHYDLPVLFGTDSLEPLQMAYDRKVLDGMIWAPLLMRVPNQFQDRAGRTYYPHSKTSGGVKVIRKFFGLDQMAFNLDVPGKIMPLSDLASKYAPEIPAELQERIDRHETNKRFNREMEIVRYAPDGRYDPYGAIPLDDPEFLAYAKQDVVTLQQVMVKLLEMADNQIDEYTWTEMFNVSIDARIASNGWRVDTEEAQRAVVVAEDRRTALMNRLQAEYDFPMEGKQPWRTTAGKQAILTALTEAGVNPEGDPDWPRTKTGVSLGGQVLVDRTEGTDAHDLAVSLAELMGQRPLAQKLLDVVFPDGRVHPDISNLQLTGRRSYNEPSLSTWTARGPGSEEKRYLIADDGCSLLEVDLSNADARAVAAYSGDENYLERFEPGVDAHEMTGRRAFGDVKYDEDPKTYRQQSKIISHGLNYGGGKTTLARMSGATEEDTERLIEWMKQTYPRVFRWQRETAEKAKTGKIVNGFGRPMWTDPNRAMTQGPSTLGQSTTTEILYAGFRRIFEHYPEWMYWLRATVHDAALWSIPDEYVDEAYDLIPKLMTIEWEPPYSTGQRVTFECDRGPKGATNWYLAGH